MWAADLAIGLAAGSSCKNPRFSQKFPFPSGKPSLVFPAPSWSAWGRAFWAAHGAGKYWRILVKELFWGKLSSFQHVVGKFCWAHGGMATIILLRSVCDMKVKFVIWKVGTDPR